MKLCISALVACFVQMSVASAHAQPPAYPPGQPAAPQAPYPPQAPPPGYPPPAPPPGYPPPGAPAQTVTGPVPLGTYTPSPGSYQHDGLYGRVMIGPGYTNMKTGDTGFSGAGFGFELALGFALSNNFALFADVVANGAVNPEAQSGSARRELKDTTAFLQNYGVGAAYFIMPANVFIAASLCGARLSLSDTSGEEAKTLTATSYGLGGNLSVGKEWWVGSELGLGAALQAAAASIDDTTGGKSSKWNAWAITLALTATLN